ncbi:MAG: hypothetical protein V7629_17720, partial [Motiliproteus sp.]
CPDAALSWVLSLLSLCPVSPQYFLAATVSGCCAERGVISALALPGVATILPGRHCVRMLR